MGLADPQRRWTIHVSEDGQWAKDEFHYNPSGKPDRWERVEVVPAEIADRPRRRTERGAGVPERLAGPSPSRRA